MGVGINNRVITYFLSMLELFGGFRLYINRGNLCHGSILRYSVYVNNLWGRNSVPSAQDIAPGLCLYVDMVLNM